MAWEMFIPGSWSPSPEERAVIKLRKKAKRLDKAFTLQKQRLDVRASLPWIRNGAK